MLDFSSNDTGILSRGYSLLPVYFILSWAGLATPCRGQVDIQMHLLHLSLISYKASGWTVSRRQAFPVAESSARLMPHKEQSGTTLEVTQGLSRSLHICAFFGNKVKSLQSKCMCAEMVSFFSDLTRYQLQRTNTNNSHHIQCIFSQLQAL